jgi:hypothetical protein
MAITKIQSESLNLADTYDFTGTVTGAGGVNTSLFKGYFTGNQSISANTDNLLAINNEHFDSDGVLDITTNQGRFTAPENGKYYFHCTFYVGLALARLRITVYKNGSALEHLTSPGGNSSAAFGATILDLSTNDYVEMYVRSSVNNSIYGSTGTKELSRFEGYKLIT